MSLNHLVSVYKYHNIIQNAVRLICTVHDMVCTGIIGLDTCVSDFSGV